MNELMHKVDVHFCWKKCSFTKVIGLFVLLVISPSSAATKDDGYSSSVTFHLLTEQIPPYSFKSENGIEGAGVDVVTQLFSRVGISVAFQIMPLKRALHTARKNKNTCIFPIQRTQEREAAFKWVSPILVSQAGLYSTKKSNLHIVTLNDAKGYVIGGYGGSAIFNYLKSHELNAIPVNNDILNFKKLLANRIDFWATDTLTASYLTNMSDRNLIKLDVIFMTNIRALACNLGVDSSVVSALQAHLIEMYRDGAVDSIVGSYKD